MGSQVWYSKSQLREWVFLLCFHLQRDWNESCRDWGRQSADSVEWLWALDPALMMGDTYQTSWVKTAKQLKRNLVNSPDEDLVLPLLGSVVSELELKA